MFRKILIATDLTESSIPAIRAGLALAQRLDGVAVVVYVAEPLFEPTPWLTQHSPIPEAEVATLRSIANRKREAAKHAIEQQIEAAWPDRRDRPAARAAVLTGVPSDSVLEEAKRMDADLIVLGTHGRRGLKHAFVGSVAEDVIRRARCPVVTTRDVPDGA